jgi:hypothetical protein
MNKAEDCPLFTPDRSELDERRSRMAELEQQVAELTMQTEYQLRLKDLHLQEKVKELTGEHVHFLRVIPPPTTNTLEERTETFSSEGGMNWNKAMCIHSCDACAEKFSAELEADRQKFELLVAEKNEGELEGEEKLRVAEERGQAAMAALDAQYQTKIMAEVERYQVSGCAPSC